MQEYHIKGNGGIGMLSAEEILEWFGKHEFQDFDMDYKKGISVTDCIKAMRIYRNQGIQQASEVCSEMLTDGFRISNIPAVLALKEEI